MSDRPNFTMAALTLTNSLTTTPVIPYSGYTCGIIETGTISATTITWYGSSTIDGTFRAMNTGAAAITTTIASDRCTTFPTTLYGVPYVKGVLNAGSETVTITLSTD